MDTTNKQIFEENYRRCPICGYHTGHNSEECTYIIGKKHIPNKKVPSKAVLSLPDELKIETLANGTFQVKTKIPIEKGTLFGPLEASKTFTLNPAVQFPLKVFPNNEEEFLDYYLDTTNEENCTWMIFVEPAECCEEQNMICYQDQHNIYYATIKDVNQYECLKVWYAPHYAEKMGKQLLLRSQGKIKDNSTIDMNRLVKDQQKILNRDNWTCKFCGNIMVDVTEFAQHIIQHYIAQLRKTCEICKSSFISRKSLHKHISVVHNPCIKKNSVSLSSPKLSTLHNPSKELSIGGPLLYNIDIIDNLDNSNLLIPSLDNLNGSLQNMETENLNVDNLLTENVKALDHFNFEIGETQEEFVCDICVKTFSKLRYLVQHLRRHTGKIVCEICKKVFSRKENLINHPCLKKADHRCTICDRIFQQKKYLNRHVQAIHIGKFKCDKCHYTYCNKYELGRHSCKASPKKKGIYICTICLSSFSRSQLLRKHLLRNHCTKNAKPYMCEICVKQYSNKYSYALHMRNHEEPSYQCEICHKKFYRKDLYQEHLGLHNTKEIECNVCKKKFSSSKSLFNHQTVHAEAKFKCPNCDKIFKSKSNLNRHSKTHLKLLTSTETMSFFTCPYCGKQFKLRSSLIRHVNRSHKEHQSTLLQTKSFHKNELQDSELVFPTSDMKNNSFLNSVFDLMTNSKDNIDSINDADINELESNLQIQMIDNILLNTTKEMGIGLSDELMCLNNLEISGITENEIHSSQTRASENREVSLSMPDLMEHVHDVEIGM